MIKVVSVLVNRIGRSIYVLQGVKGCGWWCQVKILSNMIEGVMIEFVEDPLLLPSISSFCSYS